MKKSFSSEVKSELCEIQIKQKEEAASELCAIILFGENIDGNVIKIKSEHAEIAQRVQFLIRKAVSENTPIDIEKGRKSYVLTLSLSKAAELGLYYSDNGDIELDEDIYFSENLKSAFLRGAFMAGGTISSPTKDYNCEFFTYNENMAYLSSELLSDFGIYAHIVKRNSYYVTYLKDFESIGDFLGVIGAHKSMMSLMVAQIEKDINNNVNRQANFRTANIDRTIKTSVLQCEAILKLRKSTLWNNLSDDMKTLALLRMEHTDKSLEEIGMLMSPPISKSAVSRKMKKITDMAKER